jgi:hypothetical protein
MTDRGLILFSDGRIDEIDADGNQSGTTAPGLYQELAAAGYPLFIDPAAGIECFDISVDEVGEVTAYTVGDEPREHPMGAVPPRLAVWLELTKED